MAAYPVLVPVYLVEFKRRSGDDVEPYTVVCQAATPGVSIVAPFDPWSSFLSRHYYTAAHYALCADALNLEPLHYRRLRRA